MVVARTELRGEVYVGRMGSSAAGLPRKVVGNILGEEDVTSTKREATRNEGSKIQEASCF